MKKKFEVRNGSDWHTVSIRDLTPGDVFRVFEVDGSPVENNGESVFVATSYAYKNDAGKWVIDSRNIVTVPPHMCVDEVVRIH